MIEGSKYCRDLMKKKINKELVMTKGDNDFEKSSKCRICDNDYVDNDGKVKDHRGSSIVMSKLN